MKRLFTFYLLLTLSAANAQDTLYLDKSYKETKPEEAIYFRIDDRTAEGDQDFLRRTFLINGQIKSEIPFIKKGEKLITEGLRKYWYDTGEFFYQVNYKNGKRHGELIAYWENGSKRRHDYFKRDKLKSGKVWNQKGEEIDYFPVWVQPEFPGGQKAIATYLRNTLPIPESQKSGTEVRLLVKVRIGKEGFVDTIDIIEGAPHWYNAVTTNALINMPKWNPGRFMGDPVNVWYTLPVTFRK